jgi:hypothetical protein
MVPLAGLEPAFLSELDFESSASTNFTTGALGKAVSLAASIASGNSCVGRLQPPDDKSKSPRD